MSYLLAAAGTGGHVFPALAVADELVAQGVDRSDIRFVGGERMEATTVPAAGYGFEPIDIRGLRRSWSLDNLTLPLVVARARRRVLEIIEAGDVQAVCVFGGYVAVPVAMAARSARVPLFVQEQNAVPGLANRLVARRAVAAFVGFPAAAAVLPRAVVTGNPLREPFASFNRPGRLSEARRRFDLPQDGLVVGVLGGSLGAAVLNRAVASLVGAVADRRDVAILHLTGRAHWESVQRQTHGSPVSWRAVAFEDHMEHFYAASDLVVSRAGALTISELAATGTPAVVVPYAAGTASHQEANAASLAASGGAIVVPESRADEIPSTVVRLLDEPGRLAHMSAAARSVAKVDAAAVVARSLREAHGDA